MIEDLKRRLNQFEIEFETLKKEKIDLETKNNNFEKIQTKELVEKNNKILSQQKEIEMLKSSLNEKNKMLSDYETRQRQRSEKLDDIANKTKMTEMEIDNLRQRSKLKEEKLQEVSMKLIQKSKQLRELENDSYKHQEELNAINTSLKKQTEENEQLRLELLSSQRETEDLRALLASYKHLSEDESKEKEIIYQPETGDQVDQMFAFYINETRCPVTLKKVAEGQYMFGTKKIFAKIQNEKLIIRVGGGYMMIDEFLSVYTVQELAKIKRTEKVHEVSSIETPGAKAPRMMDSECEGSDSKPLKHKKSEDHKIYNKSTSAEKSKFVPKRARSPLGMINGTQRTRVLTEQEVSNIKAVKDTKHSVPLEGKTIIRKGNTALHTDEKVVEAENDKQILSNQTQ